jgi:two-component system phosphate regulon sensor histidine kinase PhoR
VTVHVRTWKFHALRLFLGAVAVVLAGWFIGYPLHAIIIALAIYIVWHAVNIWRLNLWLTKSTGKIPRSYGIWADLFQNINSLEQKNQRQKEHYRDRIDELQSLMDAFPDAVLILDEKGALSWINHAAMSLLNLRNPQDLGQSVTNLLRGRDFANWLEEHNEAQNGKAQNGLEMQSPAGDNTWLHVSAVPFRNNQRLIILRDITNVQNVERMRRDFVANLSHELRTPLTVLLGYLELLQQQPAGPIAEAMEKMQGQARQMENMLNDLLELSRLQSSEIQNEEAFVDVPAMLIRLRTQTQELSQGKHELLFDVQEGLYLRGNESDLESAFHNLLTNAVRYTLEHGTIKVTWHDSPNGPCLSVRDNGIGIPVRDIPRLTERFYRVGADRARKSGGTGLGLAIVKHALNSHQARLLINSELNVGSEYTCCFPAERKRISTA